MTKKKKKTITKEYKKTEKYKYFNNKRTIKDNRGCVEEGVFSCVGECSECDINIHSIQTMRMLGSSSYEFNTTMECRDHDDDGGGSSSGGGSGYNNIMRNNRGKNKIKKTHIGLLSIMSVHLMPYLMQSALNQLRILCVLKCY